MSDTEAIAAKVKDKVTRDLEHWIDTRISESEARAEQRVGVILERLESLRKEWHADQLTRATSRGNDLVTVTTIQATQVEHNRRLKVLEEERKWFLRKVLGWILGGILTSAAATFAAARLGGLG